LNVPRTELSTILCGAIADGELERIKHLCSEKEDVGLFRWEAVRGGKKCRGVLRTLLDNQENELMRSTAGANRVPWRP